MVGRNVKLERVGGGSKVLKREAVAPPFFFFGGGWPGWGRGYATPCSCKAVACVKAGVARGGLSLSGVYLNAANRCRCRPCSWTTVTSVAEVVLLFFLVVHSARTAELSVGGLV